jgi:twinkle protein
MIKSEEGLTITDIKKIVEDAKNLYDIDGFVVDPYNWITKDKNDNISETEYISEVLTCIQRLCQKLELHCWFVAHPTKPTGKETDAPTLYSISGSANWANKADVGLVIHRKQEVTGEKSSLAQVSIRKVRYRESGKEGSAWFDFNLKTNRYSETIEPAGEGIGEKKEIY